QILIYDASLFSGVGGWKPASSSAVGSSLVAVSGTQNGSNKVFTLASAITAADQIYLNGQLLTPGSGNDYVISGTNLTFQAAIAAPLSTDVIRAYGYTGAGGQLSGLDPFLCPPFL